MGFLSIALVRPESDAIEYARRSISWHHKLVKSVENRSESAMFFKYENVIQSNRDNCGSGAVV